jgi:hypothetical protein
VVRPKVREQDVIDDTKTPVSQFAAPLRICRNWGFSRIFATSEILVFCSNCTLGGNISGS